MKNGSNNKLHKTSLESRKELNRQSFFLCFFFFFLIYFSILSISLISCYSCVLWHKQRKLKRKICERTLLWLLLFFFLQNTQVVSNATYSHASSLETSLAPFLMDCLLTSLTEKGIILQPTLLECLLVIGDYKIPACKQRQENRGKKGCGKTLAQHLLPVSTAEIKRKQMYILRFGRFSKVSIAFPVTVRERIKLCADDLVKIQLILSELIA